MPSICVAGFEDVPALDYRADDEQCDGLAGARVGGLEGCHVICVALVEKRCDLECARALALLCESLTQPGWSARSSTAI